MAFIDEIERFKTLNSEVNAIKSKIKEVAEGLGITVELGIDDMISVLDKIANNANPQIKDDITQDGSNLFIKSTGATLTQNEKTLTIGG